MGTNCIVSLAVIVFVTLVGTFTSLSVTVSLAMHCGSGGGGGGGDEEYCLLLVSILYCILARGRMKLIE